MKKIVLSLCILGSLCLTTPVVAKNTSNNKTLNYIEANKAQVLGSYNSGSTEEAKIAYNSVEDKKEVWHKMLNAVDYYNTINGRIVYSSSDVNNGVLVDFQSDINSSVANTQINEIDIDNPLEGIDLNSFNYSSNGIYDLTVKSDGQKVESIDNINGYKYIDTIINRENSQPLPDEERTGIEKDGFPFYVYRCDPTNTYLASICIFPQEMAFGFLTDYDLWEINSKVDYVGRNCWVITGKTEKEYGTKLNVTDFTFFVDEETGILLKYVGRDDDGNISSFLITENIDID